MKHSDFVHLHNHSKYSLLDGACRIDKMIQQALEFRMPALAITDHGNMFGAIEFYSQAMEHGIKPIIGMEAYVAPGSRTDTPTGRGGSAYHHLLLLVRNAEGYRNLMKLSTRSYLEGFYRKPRADKEILREHSAGLIASTACLQGEPAKHVLAGNEEAARQSIIELVEIFGEGNLYLEVHNHGIPQEDTVREAYVRLGKELNVPLLAANDCHYIRRDQAESHDVLLCIQTGREIDEPDRMRMANDSFYMRSPDEMRELFRDCPGAYENTIAVAERCNLQLDFDRVHMPEFPIPAGYTDASEHLAALTRDGLEERYESVTPEVEARAAKELALIDEMGFAGYFLIVHDFIHEAKRRGIPVGPGRGSAAASIVSYALGITDLDPLEFGLVFERFLNPARKSMPDFDIDFCYERRGEVIDYVTEKYGRESVAQIITFGTMQARAAIRDVGRVMKFPYSEVDRVAKMVPRELNITLEDALVKSSELKALRDSDERYAKLLDHAQNLEGLARHASVHAAGVIIAPGRIDDWAPLYRSNKNEITTQYHMTSLAQIGLLKFDFLGLRTLTVIHDALAMIKENRGVDLSPDAIPLDDQETYELLGTGHTVGVFQVESSGMQDLLRKVKPERLEDMTAVNALYRPGPLGSGMVDDYVKRKHGRQKVSYIHPKLAPVLEETHGVMAYQEQVMQISSALAGFSMSQADILLNAMRKKVVEKMATQREDFVAGCIANDIKKSTAGKVFDQMAHFAGYGFNKPHSACYAVLAVRTAYLKTHFPVEFMAATLTSEMDNSDRVVALIRECRRLGIRVLPPDVNEGHVGFRATPRGDIQFGLSAIKNVGRSAVRCIVNSRREHGSFEDVFDLTSRVDLRLVNRRVLESLVAAGALDGLHGHRAQQYETVSAALDMGQRAQRDRDSGQTSLMGALEAGDGQEARPRKLPEAKPWPDGVALAREKEVLGMYVSGHPLARYAKELATFATATTADLQEMEDDEPVRLGGIVTHVKTTNDRKGEKMAFIMLEDFAGSVELVVFSSVFGKRTEVVHRDAAVIVDGKVSTREDEEPKVLVSDVVSLTSAHSRFVERMTISISSVGFEETMLEQLRDLLLSFGGKCPVDIVVRAASGDDVTISTGGIRVEPSRDLLERLEDMVGESGVALTGSTAVARLPDPGF